MENDLLPENYENWPEMWKSCYQDGFKSGLEKSTLPKHETLDQELIALGKAFKLFLTNERFRVLGSAKLGESGYQHIGLEIWTKYRDFTEEENEPNKSCIFKYIMGMNGGCSIDSPNLNDLISAFKEG